MTTPPNADVLEDVQSMLSKHNSFHGQSAYCKAVVTVTVKGPFKDFDRITKLNPKGTITIAESITRCSQYAWRKEGLVMPSIPFILKLGYSTTVKEVKESILQIEKNFLDLFPKTGGYLHINHNRWDHTPFDMSMKDCTFTLFVGGLHISC